MARRDDDDSDTDEGRGAKASAHVSRVSHPAAGGHPSGAARAPARNQIYSTNGRRQWDSDDGSTGGDGPYQFVEYPKHVIIKGVTHTALSAEHEHAIRKQH